MNAPRNTSVVRRGFTLVEMLVVITIIAVLAGILMPTISKMKEKGRRATCANNLKQIHALVNTYMRDFDDVFPFVDMGAGGMATQNAPTTLDENYNILIGRNYTRNVKLFKCPSRVAMGTTGSGVGQKQMKFHYEYNPYLSFSKSSGSGKPPRAFKGAQVLNPSGIRLLWDSDDEGGDSGGGGSSNGNSGDGYYDPADNHGGDGGNVIYVDGHLKWWNGNTYKETEEVDPDPSSN